MPVIQDITIFSIDDDEVPILGTVDEYGDVTEATFSTDPEHPRPYMKRVLDLGESQIDFLSGSSVIGELSVEVVDNPIDPTDQDTGQMTALLATLLGDTALLGVRLLYRENGEHVFDGVIGAVEMPKLTTFVLHVRDPRERERKAQLFNAPNTGTAIFPIIGPKDGFGFATKYEPTVGYEQVGDPVMPFVKGIQGTFFDAIATPGPGIGVQSGVVLNFPLVSDDYREFLLKMGQAVPEHDAFDQTEFADISQMLWFPNVRVEWSPDGTEGSYIQLEPMRVGTLLSPRNVFDVRKIPYTKTLLDMIPEHLLSPEQREELKKKKADHWVVYFIVIQPSAAEIAAGKKPDDGDPVWVRVVSNLPPSEDVPQFIEEPFGLFLQKCFDGDYTRAGTMTPVRYDEARIEELKRILPFAVGRIDGPEDDMREFVQDEVYRPMRLAPAIRAGKIYPIKYDLPDEDTDLFELNDANTISAEWGHRVDNVINQVILEYERELVPAAIPQFEKPRTQRVVLEFNRLTEDSQRRHGSKPIELKPKLLRSVIPESQAFTRQPSEDSAGLVAFEFQDEVLRRYTNGAQVIVSRHPRTPEIDALEEGMWGKAAQSWLPDYVSGTRGINRLVQIMKVGRSDPHIRTFLLVDAGPFDVPVQQPTLGTLTEEDDGSVTIQVTDVPEGKAQVQYAFGDVEPAVDSGQWKTCGYLEMADAPGDVKTLPFLLPEETVWVRARGVADGRISSAWTDPDSVVLDALALIRDFTLTIIDDELDPDFGKPRITWEPLTGTGGIRVLYEVHTGGQVLPAALTQSEDFDATLGEAVLGVTLLDGEQITVQLVGYPGFAAGAVTGAAGAASTWLTDSFEVGTIAATLFAQVTIAIEIDGSVEITIDGSEGVLSHKYLTSLSAFPTESDVLTLGSTLDGQRISITLPAGTLDVGESIFLSSVPFSEAGAGGISGAMIRGKATRHDVDGATKTVYFGPNQLMVPDQGGSIHPSASWVITTGYAEGYDAPRFVWGLDNLQIPQGVELVEIGANMYSAISGAGPSIFDSDVTVRLQRIDDEGVQTLLATVSAVGNVGWIEDTAVLSEDTTGRKYQWDVRGDNGYNLGSAPDTPKISNYFVTYVVPSLLNTL